MPFIRFDELAMALGGYGEMVDDPRELNAAIERGLSSDMPAIINVMTDPDAISRATYGLTDMMTPKESYP